MSEKPTLRQTPHDVQAREGKESLKRQFWDRTTEVYDDLPESLRNIAVDSTWMEKADQLLHEGNLSPTEISAISQFYAYKKVTDNLRKCDIRFQNLFYDLFAHYEGSLNLDLWLNRPFILVKHLVDDIPEKKRKVDEEVEETPKNAADSTNTCWKCGQPGATKKLRSGDEFVWVHKQAKGRPGECEK